MRAARASKGFTLIEVLVAVALVAAAITLSYRGLSAVIGASETVSARLEAARDVDRLFARFERELTQRAPFEVRGATFSGGHENGEGFLSFSTIKTDDAGATRVERIDYRRTRDTLVLTTGADPSLGAVIPPRRDVLFEAVSEFSLRFMGDDLVWQDRWPASASGALPRAVELRLEVGQERALRVFALP